MEETSANILNVIEILQEKFIILVMSLWLVYGECHVDLIMFYHFIMFSFLRE